MLQTTKVRLLKGRKLVHEFSGTFDATLEDLFEMERCVNNGHGFRMHVESRDPDDSDLDIVVLDYMKRKKSAGDSTIAADIGMVGATEKVEESLKRLRVRRFVYEDDGLWFLENAKPT